MTNLKSGIGGYPVLSRLLGGSRKLLLLLALAASTLVVASVGAPVEAAEESRRSASAEGEPTTTETTTTLTAEQPHQSGSNDTGAGNWTFVVEGNRQVKSVRVAVAEGDCAAEGATLWETKITDDELRRGPVAREAAFEEAAYCSHFLLEATKKGTATITMTVPNKPVRDPDPEPDPVLTAEYDRCTDDPAVDHRVLAGATGPDPDAPFIYQKFYPSTLQVHQGELIEWCLNAGYDWHTISFMPLEMDVSAHPEPLREAAPRWWRWDETGQKAFHEDMLFGHERGDESRQCGRGPYWHLPAKEACVLSSTSTELSSSLWDRFFSVNKTGTFRLKVDENLEPGLYRYRCKIHASMHGYVEVLAKDVPLANPTPTELDAEIAGDYREAVALFRELSDPSDAYDFAKRRWNVRVGAATPDGSVAIEQFMPAAIEVRRGDQVHFIAGTDEPNTVTFPGGRQVKDSPESDLQGGFNLGGHCGPHSCSAGKGAPWGLTGLAFAWTCDSDDRASGSAVALPYVPAATASRVGAEGAKHGCVAGGLPEMVTLPWYGDQQRAPGDLVASEKTFHNSGTILDPSLPEQVRSWASNGVLPGGSFPSDFDARFPAEGTFKFFCAAHEFMNGTVIVK